MSRSVGCFVFDFSQKKSVIVKNKSTTIIHGLYECRPWKIVVDFLIVGYFNA